MSGAEPLVLVVLLGTSTDVTIDAMMNAARRALGPEATVLADTSAPTTDGDALAIGERVHARAIARVTWVPSQNPNDNATTGSSTTSTTTTRPKPQQPQPQQRQTLARLHVHVGSSSEGEWADDEIAFLPQDDPSEKGRTVGYTLATMVQRLERARADEIALAQQQQAQEQEREPPAVPTPLPTSSPTPPTNARDAERGKDREREGLAAAGASDLDLFLYGVGAVGGAAEAFGGSGGVRWWPSSHVGLRVAGGVRAGTIREVNGTATTTYAAGGPSYRVAIGKRMEAGARADVILFRHAMTAATAAGGFETTRSRFLGGVAVIVEGGWSLSRSVAIAAGVGAELAFGTTAVNVGGVTVADIPQVRGVAELGARFRF